MLGPSIMFLGTPLALGASIFAFVRTIDRPYALAGLLLSGLEAVLLGTVILLSLVR